MFTFKDEIAIGIGSESVIAYIQTQHNTQQPAQDSVHNKIIGNIDPSIKLQKFAQRFAVFSAKRLHAHNVFQFFSL